MPKKSPATKKLAPQTAEYRHNEQAVARPDVGVQPQFKRRAAPKTYRYDSSLSPALEWDGQNGARELGEWLLACIEDAAALPAPHTFLEPRELKDASGNVLVRVLGLHDAARQLKAVARPFLNWAGKAERLSFDVPTLPLFVHERLSTQAILQTLKGHKRDKQLGLFDLFADPQRPIHDQVLRAYEYKDDWVNRMILGDSLVVMNSLLHYELLGGQVQMIYMDPPYGVKFGSNFQPFVRKRDVVHNDDEDMTREPEMVQAYRDTWELGLHSYLSYLRDRLLLCRDLLAPSGSIFVQISDENLHHVREVMDEVFGAENFIVVICYRRLGMMVGETMQSSAHYLLWYARDRERTKFHKLFEPQVAGIGTGDHYVQLEHRRSGETRPMIRDERANPAAYAEDWRPFQLISLTTGGFRPNTTIEYGFGGRTYYPGPNKCWRTTREGLDRLATKGRLAPAGETLRYKQYLDDFPLTEITTIWEDTARDAENWYVVQTPSNIVRRCVLMTTDPGDIVLDPTCGSGTTAYVAEQWGRRWITIDTSRVPLALARQRVLTATFPWYELKDETRGPAGGFVYKRRQNSKGEEVGGIVPHVTLKSIANNEPPQEEVLVDRPEEAKGVTRVTGPFVVEATIPTVMDFEETSPHPDPLPGGEGTRALSEGAAFIDRMLEVLRRAPLIRLEGNRTISVRNVRRPAKTLSLSAEGVVENGGGKASPHPGPLPGGEGERGGETGKPVAFVFGPENGAVVERLVWEAAREAHAKNYTHLYVIGFAIQPPARQLIEKCDEVIGIPATYVQATPDLMMGDLLKNMRSSQVFSVCGLPEIAVRKAKAPSPGPHPTLSHEGRGTSLSAASPTKGEGGWFEVELIGLDVFDPVTMQVEHRKGDDVPAWLLDTDYNGLSFHVCQAFFPRTAAWDNLKRALKGEYEDSVWAHLAGTVSVPFETGEHKQIAVKVIDDRGNELMVVQHISG